MHPSRFKNCRFARMSDGHYCLLSNLGLVKGGKGLRHHEVVIDFNWHGMVDFIRRLISRKKARFALPLPGSDIAANFSLSVTSSARPSNVAEGVEKEDRAAAA